MIVLFLLGAALASAATKADVPAPATAKVVAGYGKVPSHFEPNQGQWESKVRFASRGPNYGLFLSDTQAMMVLRQQTKEAGQDKSGVYRQQVLTVELEGSKGAALWSAEQKLPGVSNYYVGSKDTTPRVGVPHFKSVRAAEVYPGVDVVYYSPDRTLEYDFVVHPGGNPSNIRMKWSGADDISVNASGDLTVKTELAQVVHQKPAIYQMVDGRRVAVDGRFQIDRGAVTFAVGSYDRQRDLVIDPVVRTYSALLGGTGNDYGSAVAVDASGNAFIGGYTASPAFPGNGAARNGLADAYVTKLDAAGSQILFTTYIGGDNVEEVRSLTVGSDGKLYGIGLTRSSSISGATGSLSGPGTQDAIVFRLFTSGGSAGLVDYLRYIGGNGDDIGTGVAVNSSSEMYFVGHSSSTNLPVNVGGNTAPSLINAFIGKLDSTGSSVALLRYFGGSGNDRALAVAVDSNGVHVGGSSSCASGTPNCTNDLPIPSPIRAYTPNTLDGFVVRFNLTLSSVDWGTYIGGSASEEVKGIGLDGNGNVYAAGDTGSSNFPLIPSRSGSFNSIDLFAVKIGCSDGSNPCPAANFVVKYSNRFGGTNIFEADTLSRMAVDRTGCVYLAGYATTGFPTYAAPTAGQFSYAGGSGADAILAKVTPGGRSFLYSMYFGGTSEDQAVDVTVDSQGSAYLVGNTLSTNFPTSTTLTNGSTSQGGIDAFVAKIEPYDVPTAAFTIENSALEFATFGDSQTNSFPGQWGDSVAVAQRRSNGDSYVVAKTIFTSLYGRVFEASTQQWKNWQGGQGLISGTPAIAVNETSGIAYIIVRGQQANPTDPVQYYWAKFDKDSGIGLPPGANNFEKIAGGGIFSTDPVITSCPDGNAYVIGKGYAAGFEDQQPLWMVRIDPAGGGTPGATWVSGGGQFKGKPAATCGSDNIVYVVARDRFNGVWAGRISGDSWLPWSVGGSPNWIYTEGNGLEQDPQIASDRKGKIFVGVATLQNSLYWFTIQQGVTPSNPPGSWNYTGGFGTGLEYSLSAISGDLFIAARLPGTGVDNLLWWRSSAAPSVPVGSIWDFAVTRPGSTIKSVSATPK